jgi:hypothetical protein
VSVRDRGSVFAQEPRPTSSGRVPAAVRSMTRQVVAKSPQARPSRSGWSGCRIVGSAIDLQYPLSVQFSHFWPLYLPDSVKKNPFYLLVSTDILIDNQLKKSILLTSFCAIYRKKHSMQRIMCRTRCSVCIFQAGKALSGSVLESNDREESPVP